MGSWYEAPHVATGIPACLPPNHWPSCPTTALYPTPPLCSLPAIEDIRDCLQNTNLHRKFVAVFRRALTDRLLHPGGWGG